MKQKLDEALLRAAPSVEKKPDSFVAAWDGFGGGTRYNSNSVRLATVFGHPSRSTEQKLHDAVQSWDSIPYMLGNIHRMAEEGHAPLRKLGFSADDEATYLRLCREIRHKLTDKAITTGQPAEKATLTKTIYDSIVANRF